MALKFPGAQAVVYVMTEGATYGQPQRPLSHSAIRTISETMTPSHERDARPDRTSSADYLDQYSGRYGATWEIQKLLLPTGDVTVKPDDHWLWDAGLGKTSIGTTSINYMMATAHSNSLTIRRGVRGGGTSAGEFQEHVVGAIVQKIDIGWGSQGQNGLATVTFGGVAKKWGFTGNSSLNCDGTQMGKVVSGITLVNARQFTEGAVVMVNTDSHGGTQGLLVTRVNLTTNRLSFNVTGMNSTHMDGSVVKAWNPTPVTSGAPIHAKLGYLTLDASVSLIKHLGGRVSFESGLGLVNDEVGTDSASEVVRESKYKTTVSLDFIMKTIEVPRLLGSAYDDATAAKVHVGIGSGTGGIVELVMKNVKWDIVSPEVPAEGDARITMSGRAYGVNGQDALKVRIK